MAGHITIELQQLLDARGMSQRELSRISGVRQERISRICKGFVDRLELDHIVKICDALQVPPWAWIIYTSEWMFADEDEAEEPADEQSEE
jgi:putative transcriptional regulator